MKRIIRKGVFESNSSSQHSLAIMKKSEYYTTEEIMDDIYLNKDGSWNIWESNLEFGRSPFKCLGTFSEKFEYALAALASYKDETYNELERIAFKYIEGLTKLIMPTATTGCPIANPDSNSAYIKEYGKTENELVKMLMEQEEKYGIEMNYWTNSNETYWMYEEPCTGSAEDYGMLKRFLEEEKVSLEEFLTNKKYIIICDGDEYCIWDSLKQNGLINLNTIDYEYPKNNCL